MKILVTGASGVLGREVLNTLKKDSNMHVTGTCYSRRGGGLVTLDLLDYAKVRSELERLAPSLVIHCAAERKPDVCEDNRKLTLDLNVGATKNLAEICSDLNCDLIYISSDYVFDGTEAPYCESDRTNPINFYGKTKLQGEEAVIEYAENYYILRVPVIYGKVIDLQENSITAILKTVLSKTIANIDHWAVRCPTHTIDIASVIYQMANRIYDKQLDKGIYQWSGEECFTKYDIAKIIAKEFGVDDSHLIPDTDPKSVAQRPYNAHLDSSKLRNIGISSDIPFKQGIVSVLKEFIDEGSNSAC